MLSPTDTIQFLYRRCDFYDPGDKSRILWNVLDVCVGLGIVSRIVYDKNLKLSKLADLRRKLQPRCYLK
jgi:hypothetical protein